MEVGQTLTQKFTVTEAHTAIALGSGNLPVLSTPYMIACMENTAMTLLAEYLEQGADSVGTYIETKHNKASKVGELITYNAEITSIEGRKISFTIEAYNQKEECIGTSIHTRFIIDIERFMSSL